MKVKTPKRYELVKFYLQKILSLGHHDFYDVHMELSPDELIEFYKGILPDLKKLEEINDAHEVLDRFLGKYSGVGCLDNSHSLDKRIDSVLNFMEAMETKDIS